METWAVVSRLRDSRTAAARTVYGRLLAASLQDPNVLSHHPAAVGAYFRLLTLGLVYGKSCLDAAGSGVPGRAGVAAGADVLLLFDRILRAVSQACLSLVRSRMHRGAPNLHKIDLKQPYLPIYIASAIVRETQENHGS